MVDIKYLGKLAFLIGGKKVNLLFNPDGLTDKQLRNLSAEIVFLTSYHTSLEEVGLDRLNSQPFIVFGPGEYEISKVVIIGLPVNSKETNNLRSTVYYFELDNLSFGFLAGLNKRLDQSQLEVFGNVDVLFLPVGEGKSALNIQEGIEVIAQVEPKIVIPIISDGDFRSESLISKFLAEAGKGNPVSLPKLSLSADKLPEETEIVFLNSS